jgi:O-antigen ligase
VAKHPVVGAGIGQDILVMNDERGIDTWRRVHNAYLQYGVDLGLPGLLLFVWLHLTCYRTARAVEQRAAAVPSLRDLQPLATGVKMSLVAFGVAAMFHPIAYHFYFFSVAGLAVALRNTYRTAVGMTAGAGFITHAGRGFTPRQAGREGPPYGYETASGAKGLR